MSEITVKPILQSDEINIDLCYYEDTPFISYFKIETDKLFYSIDLVSVNHRCKTENNLKDVKEVTINMIIDFLIKDNERYVELYNEAVEADNPRICTTYHNRRDLVHQSMKIMLDTNFSDMALYEYLIDTYSYIEDGFEYMIIYLDKLLPSIKDKVEERVKKDLKEYQNITSDKIVVYRGFNQYSREDGLSFTFDYDTAKFFANRWGEGEGYINKYEVNVSDIFAYIHHEQEVVTDKAVFLEKVN